MSVGAIQRVLTELEHAGMLIRQNFGHVRSLFELADRGPHDHLICVTCGAIEDVDDPVMSSLRKRVAANHGLELHHHQLVLHGRCARPACRAGKPT